jgi:hypothetical protein
MINFYKIKTNNSFSDIINENLHNEELHLS